MNSPFSQRNAVIEWIIITGFLFVIFAPGPKLLQNMLVLHTATQDDWILSDQGKRRITWMMRAQDMVAKNFGLRQLLIHTGGLLNTRLLKSSPNSGVVLGKDGWLFLGAEFSTGSSRHSDPFTEVELQQWQRYLEGTRDRLAKKNIKYLFVIAPDKHTIYPEFVPDVLRQPPGSTRCDQLMAHLRRHSSVGVLDLREPLWKAKATGLLYYRTDSHWNDRGAYIAYHEILGKLIHQFPALRIPKRSEFDIIETPAQGGDCARMIGLEQSMTEPGVELRPRRRRLAQDAAGGEVQYRSMDIHFRELLVTERPNAEVARAVLVHDSFGERLMPLLAEHFGRFVQMWIQMVPPDVVAREHPDVVIQEVVERNLLLSAPDPEGRKDPQDTKI